MWRWGVDKWQVGNERGVGGRVRNVVCEMGRWERRVQTCLEREVCGEG